MDRNFLYRSYGYTLERILDVHGIKGSRQSAKRLLHEAFKKAKGIKTLTKLSNHELENYIQEINNFFPLNHTYDGTQTTIPYDSTGNVRNSDT